MLVLVPHTTRSISCKLIDRRDMCEGRVRLVTCGREAAMVDVVDVSVDLLVGSEIVDEPLIER